MWVIGLALVITALFRLKPAEPPTTAAAPEQTNLERTMVEIKAVEKMTPPPPEAPPAPAQPTLSAKPKAKPADSSEGRVIPIVADYRLHLGFPVYVREMRRLGAMFMLFDPIHEKLIAEVDISSKSFGPIDTKRLQTMSPNIREISNEIAVEELQQKARTAYSLPICSIIMLLPKSVDQRITEEITSHLVAKGIEPTSVTAVAGVYLLRAGGIALRVNNAGTESGVKNIAFDVPL
jgi:hypothetical protein